MADASTILCSELPGMAHPRVLHPSLVPKSLSCEAMPPPHFRLFGRHFWPQGSMHLGEQLLPYMSDTGGRVFNQPLWCQGNMQPP